MQTTEAMLENQLKRLIKLTGNESYHLKYFDASQCYQLMRKGESWEHDIPGLNHRYKKTKMLDVLRAYIAGIELGGVLAIKTIQGG